MNDKYLWAYSDKAREAIEAMEAAGLDRDLAIVLIEKLLPEEEIYALDE